MIPGLFVAAEHCQCERLDAITKNAHNNEDPRDENIIYSMFYHAMQ